MAAAPPSTPRTPENLPGLSGLRLALVGFEPAEAGEIAAALTSVNCACETLAAAEASPTAPRLAECCCSLLNLSEAIRATAWTNAEQLALNAHPFIAIGSEDELFKWPIIQSKAGDVILRPYRISELLVRASRLVARTPARRPGDAAKGAVERRVVIADDDPAITAIIKVLLKGYHFECHIAHDGEEALVSARMFAPDLVILDVNMPRLNGFDVLKRLREDPARADTRVVLLTASDEDADVARGVSLGADDYIRKPFSMFELASRVKRLLRPAST